MHHYLAKTTKQILSTHVHRERFHLPVCPKWDKSLSEGVFSADKAPSHLSQWLHLNGFAPVCFLKCLVNSSLRAKRHSQPSHEHLYGFSPAKSAKTDVEVMKIKNRSSKKKKKKKSSALLEFLSWPFMNQHRCYLNIVKSISPGPGLMTSVTTHQSRSRFRWTCRISGSIFT